MSNMPSLRTVHGRGAYMSRPKHTWKGLRPPRSARRRWELEQMIRKAMEPMTRPRLKLPEHPPDPGCGDPLCELVQASDFVLTPWQHRLLHQTKEENVA